MRKVIINETEYILNSYYTEQNGRLHLFINNENTSYDLNKLKTDIQTGPVAIYDDELKLGEFTNYTLLRSMEIRVDTEPQIYVITDAIGPSAIIDALQNKVDSLEGRIIELENIVRNLTNPEEVNV